MSKSLLTKRALANSLKQLMEKVSLNKITVQDIVDNCELNRQTFYYHFKDILDLLGWIYKTEAVDSIAEYKSYMTWKKGFLKIFLYISDNREFCLNALNSLGRDHLDTFLYPISHELLMGVINEVARNMRVTEGDKGFIVDFYVFAFMGLLIQWMRRGMDEKPELIMDKLSDLMEGNFVKALKRYEQRL